jgi:hypothetical protein
MKRSHSWSASVSVFLATWAAGAAADTPNLKGAYGFTGTAACLVAPGNSGGNPGNDPPGPAGFNSSLQPRNNGSSFSHSFAVEGIRKFNGDGTGTLKGTSTGITVRPTPGPPPAVPHFPASAGSSSFSFSFTYTVNGDGSWTSTMVPGTFTETFVTGPRSTQNPANLTNQTATIDAIPQVTGLISQDGKTLIAVADPTDSNGAFIPTIETITYSNGDVWPQICHRSRVFIKLQGDDDGRDRGDDGR